MNSLSKQLRKKKSRNLEKKIEKKKKKREECVGKNYYPKMKEDEKYRERQIEERELRTRS